ncbi:MAG: transposase [Sporomusa sp.]|nr:transposase [Sporomusa sp.]
MRNLLKSLKVSSEQDQYISDLKIIYAHFLICFVSLLILRVLEYKLDKKYPVSQIRDSLTRYSCSHLDQNYYLFDYRDEILQLMESVFDIDLGHKIMSRSEIKKFLQYYK